MTITNISERRERAKHVPAILLSAIVCLDAPQRDQYPSLDAEFPFHSVEELRPFLRLVLAGGDPPRRGNIIDVGADRLAIFGLAPGGGDYALIGRNALHRGIECDARNPHRLCIRPQLGDEGSERLLLRLRRRAACENESDEGQQAEGHALQPRCEFISYLIRGDTNRLCGRSSGPAIFESCCGFHHLAGTAQRRLCRSSTLNEAILAR